MSEKPATLSQAVEASEKPATASQDQEITRVNTKRSADSPVREKTLEEIESSYYLTGRRLWLVHTGILL